MQFVLSFIVLLLFQFQSVLGQAETETKEVPPTDTVKVSTIDLTELPIRSASSRIRAVQIQKDTTISSQIGQKNITADSLFRGVAKVFITYDTLTTTIKSTRVLENAKIELQTEKLRVDEYLKHINSLVNQLTDEANFLQNEDLFWKEVINNEQITFFQEALGLDTLYHQLAVSGDSIRVRMQKLLNILNKGTQLSLYGEKQIEKIDKQTEELKSLLIMGYYPPFYKLFHKDHDWTFGSYLSKYIKSEKIELYNYFKIRKGRAAIIVLLFIGILLTLLAYKRRIIRRIGRPNTFRGKIALISVKSPISTAILISLFWGIIVLDNRPFAIRDFFTFLLIAPLILIMLRTLPRKFQIYTFIVIATTVLHTLFVILPATNALFRINLVAIHCLQFLLAMLAIRHSKQRIRKGDERLKILNRLAHVYAFLAILGLLANLFGQVFLAQILELSIFLSIGVGLWMIFLVNLFQVLTIAALESETAQNFRYIKNNLDTLKRKLHTLVAIIGILFWLSTFLVQLHLYEDVLKVIGYLFEEKYSIGSVEFSFGTLIIFFVVLYLSIVFSKFVRDIIEGDILHQSKLPKGVPYTVAVISRYAIITIGVLLAISVAGVDISSLTIIIGAFSVGIGFGLQNIINNLVSGLILLFERPVQIGDTIEIGDLLGTVKSIGIRSSNISTIDGAEVIVPNGNLISSELINWTLSNQRRRIEIIAGVSYSSDPHQVQELLTKVINNHEEVLKWPRPDVFFNEMADSSLNFRVLAWVDIYDDWVRVKSELTFQIFDILGENNIEIPFPQRDIHIKNE